MGKRWLDGLIVAAITVGWLVPAMPRYFLLGGFPALQVSLVAIAAPLLALLFARRLWAAGRYYGASSSGELLARHFESPLLGLIVSAYGLILAFLLAAYLIPQPAPGGPVVVWIFGGVLLAAGLWRRWETGIARSLAVLFALGAVAMIAFKLADLGGIDGYRAVLHRLLESHDLPTTHGRGGGDLPYVFAIPGTVELSGFPGWTVARTFSVILALAALPLLPALSRWTVGDDDPRRFAGRHLLFAAAVGGIILLAAGFMGGDAHVTDESFGGIGLPLTYGAKFRGSTTATLPGLATQVLSLFAVALLFGGAVLFSLGAPGKSPRPRAAPAIALLAALAVVTWAPEYKPGLSHYVSYGSLALVLAPQLLTPVAALCWFPAVGARALLAGLVAGVAGAALATYYLPPLFFGALWGLAANAAVTFLVSLFARDGDTARRAAAAWIAEHAAIPADRRHLILPAWIATLLWAFFAVGPGAVIGNDVFGVPLPGQGGFEFGWPSLMIWQVLFWLLGLALLWFLAYGLGLARWTRAEIDAVLAASPR